MNKSSCDTAIKILEPHSYFIVFFLSLSLLFLFRGLLNSYAYE